MIGVNVTFDYDGDFDRARILKVAENARGMFEGMPGLHYKFFTFDEKQQRATNFYVWESEQQAEGFFTDELRERVIGLYGVAPVIDFIEIAEIVDNTEVATPLAADEFPGMRCEVLAIGTELLLGQIVDTNSAWIGEQFAASGIDSYEHRVIGDNQTRIVDALKDLLERSDSVLICGGLGPTQDDLTRDAIVELMGVPLVRRMELAETIATMFRSRLRDMPQNNLRQADVPEGGEPLPNPLGTAPGLVCPVGDGKVVYAVPGVPYEMQEMVRAQVIPDLLRRSGKAAAIVSRSLKTWGTSESALAEMVAHRLDALDAAGNPTIAFLARGIEGLVVRITAKADTEDAARALVEAEERELRAILGDLVFGVDDETMEHAVLSRLHARNWTLGVAESVTGGLIGARIASVPGASETFRGTIGAYATDVKRSVLGVTAELVVSEESAKQMAMGAQRVLGADVGIAVTGVAGPTEQDGVAVGTVCFGIAMPDGSVEAVTTRLPGDRERVRQFSTISLLSLLRQRLDALP